MNPIVLFFSFLNIYLCPTLCDPVNCSPPGSPVHGRGQEYCSGLPFHFPGVFGISRGYFHPRDWTWVSCLTGRFFTIWDTREALIMPILAHFMIFYKSLRFSSLFFFHFFFFFISLTGYFQTICLWISWSLLFLDQVCGWTHSANFRIQLFLSSVPKFLFGSFLYFPTLLIISFCLHITFLNLLSVFMMIILNFLSDNS